ncbi:unnamed protein product [Phytomonas sp. Hart1]|nr:unnamed protein product [Phytomonas sp. Hart1]|eukprot:CCW67129.1 unnamed protein product [Phytomonas sp. isolate Hart1]
MRLFIVISACLWVLALTTTISILPRVIDAVVVKGLHAGVSHGRIGILRTLDCVVNLTQYREAVPSPFYTLASVNLKEDVSNEIFRFLVQKSFDINGDASYNFHPLTAACRNGHLNITNWFITEPNTIPEVYMNRLYCDDLKTLYPNITLVLQKNEIRRCAFRHPQTTYYSSSKLKSYYEATYKRPQPSHFMSNIDPVGGVPDVEWWKNTARNLHPLFGTIDKPWTVVNPAYFHDFFSVLFFYLLSPLDDTVNLLTVVAAFAFGLIWSYSWIRALSQ